MQEYIKKSAIILVVIQLLLMTGCSIKTKEINHKINYDKNDLEVTIKIDPANIETRSKVITLKNETACQLVEAFNQMILLENPLDSNEGAIGKRFSTVVISTKGKNYTLQFDTLDYSVVYDSGHGRKYVCCDFSNVFFDLVTEYSYPLPLFLASKGENRIYSYELCPLFCTNDTLNNEAAKKYVDEIIKESGIKIEEYLNNVFIVENKVTYGQFMNQIGVEEYDNSVEEIYLLDLFVKQNNNKLEYYKTVEYESLTIKVRPMICLDVDYDIKGDEFWIEDRDVLIIKVNK